MSDYSEEWYELHKDTILRENECSKKHKEAIDYRERMISELSTNTMISIIFNDCLCRQTDEAVIDLGKKLLEISK